LTGVWLSGAVFSITAVGLLVSPFSSGLLTIIILEMVFLFSGVALLVGERLERLWVMMALVPFGVLATIASTAHAFADPDRGYCFFVLVKLGFPLPWTFRYDPNGLVCPLPSEVRLSYPGPSSNVFFSPSIWSSMSRLD
jgi:hypothetical protein